MFLPSGSKIKSDLSPGAIVVDLLYLPRRSISTSKSKPRWERRASEVDVAAAAKYTRGYAERRGPEERVRTRR